MTFGSSRTGTGINNSNPEVRDQEGNGKNPFPKFGNRKGKKKSIPTFRERESEAIIPGNSREQERECKTNKSERPVDALAVKNINHSLTHLLTTSNQEI